MNRFISSTVISFLSLFSFGQSALIKQLDPLEFNQQISAKQGTLLDVRTPSEFSNGHIEDAGQLNYYSFDFKQRLLMLPKDQPVYLYCNTGYRSQKAAEILIKSGYSQVFNLQHGIMVWNLNDQPVIVEPDARPDGVDKIEPDEFAAFIDNHSLTLVDYYAPWCAPCRQMMPVIDSLGEEYRDQVSVIKVNADASSKLVKGQRISGVPYFVLYRNGEIIFTHSGLISKEKLGEVLFSAL
ncbi:MAG: thioredoxin domain-containing protein [Bacteroidales bacterium]|nr:thioredoxin domain-containing protein [Bacteroidales bacterium]MDT8374272.1 thioredoxin domain-containing protein [Bacteroidales bacterium]